MPDSVRSEVVTTGARRPFPSARRRPFPWARPEMSGLAAVNSSGVKCPSTLGTGVVTVLKSTL
eukprot:1549403-Prymnesium_polylepis.1